MKDLKPIEAGCRAIIINSKCNNDGKSVDVIKLDGELTEAVGEPIWTMRQAVLDVAGGYGTRIRETQLMRIDSDADDTAKFEAEARHEKRITALANAVRLGSSFNIGKSTFNIAPWDLGKPRGL